MRHRFAVCALLVVLVSSLVGGFLTGKAAPKPEADASTAPNEFLIELTEALDVIQKTYVEDVSPDRLVYNAIKGMLRSLDPHSNFFDPKEFSSLREDQHSRYFGLGIKVRPLFSDQGRVVILEPPTIGSPAQRRGLRAGDVIMRIEGVPIDDWTSDEVVNHLRGPRGTEVHISVERPGITEILEFTVERDEIPVNTISYAFKIRPGVGYIRIDRFSETTADDFQDKLDAMEFEKLSGLILDLRENPGGLLNQAIEISDFFLPRHETIVSTRGRAQGADRTYKAKDIERIKIPLVVLINRHSASASEIVAGALQDHDRALILGETSFGKGLVQTVYPLDSNTGMALTTAKYYTPSERLIQRDYSVSSFEYYYMNETLPEHSENISGREIKQTDGGRTVLGGGGITPDIPVPVRELERFEAVLVSKYVFFQYARRLISGQVTSTVGFTSQLKEIKADESGNLSPELLPDLVITEEILADFRKYLIDQNIEFSEKDINNSSEFIKRRIKQDVFTLSFGPQEGYKIGVQGDAQVLKALEVLPEAKLLMTSGRTKPAMQNRSN